MAAITTDWRAQITDRLEIQPTIEAMQRHFYFGLRAESVVTTEAAGGTFQTDVHLQGVDWTGSGTSPEESMGHTLLSMTEPDAS